MRGLLAALFLFLIVVCLIGIGVALELLGLFNLDNLGSGGSEMKEEKTADYPVIVGVGDPLRDFRFGEWRGFGSRSMMIEVYVFPNASTRSYLIRSWRFFACPCRIKDEFLKEPYNFTFIVNGREIVYPAKRFRISFYLYTEAVFISYNGSIRLIDEELGVDIDLSELSPMRTGKEESEYCWAYTNFYSDLQSGVFVGYIDKSACEMGKEVFEYFHERDIIPRDKIVAVVLAMGQKNTGGYFVAVEDVGISDGVIHINASFVSPPPESMVIQIVTRPAALVELGKFAPGEYRVIARITYRTGEKIESTSIKEVSFVVKG